MVQVVEPHEVTAFASVIVNFIARLALSSGGSTYLLSTCSGEEGAIGVPRRCLDLLAEEQHP